MEFNVKRLLGLVTLDHRNLLTNKVLKIVGIVFIFWVILSTYGIIRFESNITNSIYLKFISFYLITSVVVGTLVFLEMSKASDRISYMSLPASIMEKIVSKFIVSMIAFPIWMLSLYSIGFYLIKISVGIFSDHYFVAQYSNQSPLMTSVIHISLVIVSVFAYGSIKYNNLSFVKIILRLGLMIVIIGAITFLIGLATSPIFRAEVFGYEYAQQIVHNGNGFGEDHWFQKLGMFSFHFLIIPVFWVLTYFTLKEKEA